MAWVSVVALRADRAEFDASRRAVLEENARLALWRMDSFLAPLLAMEGARPVFEYRAFYPAERAYTRMFAQIQPGEVLVPSPLLTEDSPYVLLHFQVGPDGTVSSPQVPTGNMRDLAESGYTTQDRIVASAARLEELEGMLDRDVLLASLPRDSLREAVPALTEGLSNEDDRVRAACAVVLGEFGAVSKVAVPELERVAQDRDSEAGRHARTALEQIHRAER